MNYICQFEGENLFTNEQNLHNSKFDAITPIAPWHGLHSWSKSVFSSCETSCVSSCIFLTFSMHKRLCLIGQFNYAFDQSHSHKDTFGCGFCFFWQPRFLKESFTCFSRHSIRALLSTDSYIALTLILNPHDQNEVSSLKDFSKIFPLSLHGELFFHQLIYLS